MREIAAASDFDFVATEPRRVAPKRGKAKKKSKAAWARLAALRRYITPFLAVAALVALLAAVAVNAMYLQHGRHPAPLFGATFKVEPPKPPPRPAHLDFLFGEKLPSRPPGPASATEASLTSPPLLAAKEAPAASPTPAAGPAANAPAAKPAALSPHNQDGIGERQPAAAKDKPAAAKDKPAAAKDKPAAAKDKAARVKVAEKAKTAEKKAAPAAPANAMALTQRALKKLGAPVKTDGHFDVATRNAVEAFQRRNNLPVSGELTAETRHLLATRSGLPVE